MKPLYSIPEVSNHWFITYYIYHKDKLKVKELIYKPYLLYSSGLFDIIGIQINDILILIDNDFARKKEVAIKIVKIMTKDLEYLTFSHLLKFDMTKIKLNLEGIVLKKESHIGSIFFITNYNIDSISSRGITRKKLSPKKQYLAQKAKDAYITFVYQLEVSFNLF